jgi:predicted extracellular nuclease
MQASRRQQTCLLITTTLAIAACGGGSSGAAMPEDPGSTTRIADVQGNSESSPLVGRIVEINGVVTGDFQDNDENRRNNLGGFFLQSVTPDTDPLTSDGIFVFDGDNSQTDVRSGDRVVVTGKVQEHFGETQIAASTVSITGRGSTTPVELSLPVQSTFANADNVLIADLEAYEGALVRLSQTLTVSDNRNLERFGELRLSAEGRLTQFTNLNPPGVDAYAAHRDDIAARSIVLDDGQRMQNARPIRYLEHADGNAIRAGDTVNALVGVLRFSRGSGGNGLQTWRLVPTVDPGFTSSNPRPDAPTLAGNLRIAGVNMQNLFSGLDNRNARCGPTGSDGCRGADNAAELDRQLAKMTTALVMMDADIVGIVEIENNKRASIQLIVDALNERLAAETYAFVDTGIIGNDAIRIALIYKTSSVMPSGSFAILDGSVDARFNDDKNRPVLAQTFQRSGNGAALTVAVAHLKSKGSDCIAEGDPNISDGQGNCNVTRRRAAEAMADWLQSDPTSSGDSDVLIIGDLNAYLREDPVAAMRSAGLTNLLDRHSTAYSFVFDGQRGALDHALVSTSLLPQVVDIVEWHINADESPVHDYNLEHGRDAALFDAAHPYRSSDHDPLIIGLDLN